MDFCGLISKLEVKPLKDGIKNQKMFNIYKFLHLK